MLDELNFAQSNALRQLTVLLLDSVARDVLYVCCKKLKTSRFY